jgi:hypothetical protein
MKRATLETQGGLLPWTRRDSTGRQVAGWLEHARHRDRHGGSQAMQSSWHDLARVQDIGDAYTPGSCADLSAGSVVARRP